MQTVAKKAQTLVFVAAAAGLVTSCFVQNSRSDLDNTTKPVAGHTSKDSTRQDDPRWTLQTGDGIGSESHVREVKSLFPQLVRVPDWILRDRPVHPIFFARGGSGLIKRTAQRLPVERRDLWYLSMDRLISYFPKFAHDTSNKKHQFAELMTKAPAGYHYVYVGGGTAHAFTLHWMLLDSPGARAKLTRLPISGSLVNDKTDPGVIRFVKGAPKRLNEFFVEYRKFLSIQKAAIVDMVGISNTVSRMVPFFFTKENVWGNFFPIGVPERKNWEKDLHGTPLDSFASYQQHGNSSDSASVSFVLHVVEDFIGFQFLPYWNKVYPKFSSWSSNGRPQQQGDIALSLKVGDKTLQFERIQTTIGNRFAYALASVCFFELVKKWKSNLAVRKAFSEISRRTAGQSPAANLNALMKPVDLMFEKSCDFVRAHFESTEKLFQERETARKALSDE